MLFAVLSFVAANAFVTLEPALAAADAMPPSPMRSRLRGEDGGAVLLPADIYDSAQASAALAQTLPSVDQANVEVACDIGGDATSLVMQSAARITRLSEALLVLSAVDAASGNSAQAVAQVTRAVDVTRMLTRCRGAALYTADVRLVALMQVIRHATFLFEHALLDRQHGKRLIDAIDVPLQSDVARLQHGQKDSVRQAVAARAAETRAALERARLLALSAPETIAQGNLVAVPDVPVRCREQARGQFTVSPPVLAALSSRGADAIIEDSQVFFALDGTGLMLVRAGPAARSCGLMDGDLLVDVNGQRPTPDQVLLLHKNVIKDGRAQLVVRRHGELFPVAISPEAVTPERRGRAK